MAIAIIRTNKRKTILLNILLVVVSMVVGYMPPLPGIYYDFKLHNKMGFPFSGYRYTPSDDRKIVYIHDVNNRLIGALIQDGKYVAGENEVTTTDLFRFRLTKGISRAKLGDRFGRFKGQVYDVSSQLNNGTLKPGWAVDYQGIWMMVLLQQSDDKSGWRSRYELYNSVGFPSAFPAAPLASYHYIVFFLFWLICSPIIPANRNWMIDKYVRYRPFHRIFYDEREGR